MRLLGKDGWPSDDVVISSRDKEIATLRQQLAEAQRDAKRWKFYAGRVAARIGISMEQFTDDIDQAMRGEGE